ncbi:MAG: hypothetical protein JWO00_675 [Candidatus Parcubacteria bacterium]|nr:hypothetical protein [Candidatus Parcubacteria bacterium]
MLFMDDILSVQTDKFANLLRDYALADEGRRPDLLAKVQETMLEQGRDYARDIIHAFNRESWRNPSAEAQKLLAELLFAELDAKGGKTSATVEELYQMYILLHHRLFYAGTSSLVAGFRNNRIDAGLIERTFASLNSIVHVSTLMKMAKLQGAEISDLLPLLAHMSPDKKPVHIQRAIKLASHYLEKRVSISKEAFLKMLETPPLQVVSAPAQN